MTQVLVTGAAGYIGSVLTRMLLERGYSVVALDRFFFGRQTLPGESDNFRVIRGDVRSLDRNWFEGTDAVIDLAALSNDPAGELDPDKTMQINYCGRVEVARTAKAMGVSRYILPSSCSIYGFQDGVVDEGSPVNPLTTYAKANYLAEQGILPLADDSFCATVIRQATVYGLSPRMRFDLAINGMTRGIFQNGRIPILRDGTQWRPFVHVRDTSRAMIRILEASTMLVQGEVFNVGSDDQNVQIMPLARTASEAAGVPFEYEWYGDPDHRSYRVSFRKIGDILGYEAEETIPDGAREVYRALEKGELDADDPRTITVAWYKQLIEMQRVLKEVELEGVLL